MRERLGRTLPTVTMAEADGVALVHQNVDRMATLSADEAAHWDLLHAGWSVDRVNHSEVYSDHGKHTNWAESCFSRLRRMVGWKITAALATACWPSGWWQMRWVARCRGLGRATGSERRDKNRKCEIPTIALTPA